MVMVVGEFRKCLFGEVEFSNCAMLVLARIGIATLMLIIII